jgi:NAD(P)-dependent dehydrogenase (short-subunit alcohol dehydrogenase family)
MASVQSQRPQALTDSGVLIVGGTSGLGRALARDFMGAGELLVATEARSHLRRIDVSLSATVGVYLPALPRQNSREFHRH